jgi:hypothetical protein
MRNKMQYLFLNFSKVKKAILSSPQKAAGIYIQEIVLNKS